MKTYSKIATLIASLTILLSLNLTASVTTFDEESYINDIPFNTTEIFNDYIANTEFNFEEESYINDIPLFLECAIDECKYENAINTEFILDEENYIDDIPFNTECVTEECLFENAIAQEFGFENEDFINDINL